MAFAAGWLRGYIDGAQGVANSINVTRTVAQCTGEEGCEWLLNESTGKGGQPVASIPGLRYHNPYAGTPILRRLINVDVAKPLRPSSTDDPPE